MIITKETIESTCRPLDRKWTLEPMADIEHGIDLEQELFDILQQEIENEMVAAGHGTKAERDQKIIDQIIQVHKEMVHKDFDDAKTAL